CFFFLMICRLARSTLFPYTTLFRSLLARATQREHEISVRFSLGGPRAAIVVQLLTETFVLALGGAGLGLIVAGAAARVFRTLARDRKSTRLNSSHDQISYAVFCLKK